MRFNEAFKNILDNAINYSSENSKVEVKIDKKDNNYVVSVHNDGPAIPDQDRNKLFTRFYRGEGGVRTKPSGSGLGLYVAKSNIELLNGKIWFESPTNDNQGVTFYISLPLS